MSEEKEIKDVKSDKKKIDPSSLIRALALRVQEETSPDLSPKYIGKRGNGDRDNLDNGIICRAGAYYRLAEDVSTGNRVLLCSSTYSNLVGARDEDGNIRLKDPEKIAEKIIAVSAFCPVLVQDEGGIKGSRPMKGRKFRHAMNIHEAENQEKGQNSLNIYPSDITTLLSQNKTDEGTENKKTLRRIILPSDKVSYGFYEQEDGKWLIRRHINTEEELKKKSEVFVYVDEQAPDGPLDQAVSMGEQIGIYDSLPEAYAHMVVESKKGQTA